MDSEFVHVNSGMVTNHHYVLSFQAERTILIKHENYPYSMPANFEPPRWIYLSSAGEASEQFHLELADGWRHTRRQNWPSNRVPSK